MMMLWRAFILWLASTSATAFAPRQWSTSSLSKVLKAASSDAFDMNELQKRLALSKILSSSSLLRMEQSLPDCLFLVVYDDIDGVHAIEHQGRNVVLAFAEESACDDFCADLASTMARVPRSVPVSINVLDAVCEQLGVHAEVVPTGRAVIPPTRTKAVLGHDPSLRARQSELDYIYAMMEEDFADEGVVRETVVGVGSVWD